MTLEVSIRKAYGPASPKRGTCLVVRIVGSRLLTIDLDGESCAVVLDAENDTSTCVDSV